MTLPTWSVKNRVAVNLLCVLILVAGWLSATTRLKIDLFPDVSTNFIQITTLDPTISAAEEIERTITTPIEEELANIQGLKKITSLSEDSFSNIFIELDPSITNTEPALNEVRQAIDRARQKLPTTAEPPVIEEFDIPLPLITFTVSYPLGFDPLTIRDQLDEIQRRLRLIPGVSKVLTDGLDRREVQILLDPSKLHALRIPIQHVADAVRRANLNTVAGRLENPPAERLLRILGEARQPSDLADIAIPTPKALPGSPTTLLRDIASLRTTTEEPRTIGRADLLPATTFTIIKKKRADAIQTVELARKAFFSEAQKLPPEVTARALGDTTKFIRVRIQTVLQNGLQALLFVTLLLLLMLDWRIAILVAIGIPISFAGSFIILHLGGFTINLLSLFGMIMALGMVVDDAVVMSENAFRYIQSGHSTLQAAIRGANEVLWPVFGSVSTTVAAFLPLIWAEGIIGKFLLIVPVVVISTLCFSLLQAFVVLPSHIADFAALKFPSTSSPRLKNLTSAISSLYADTRTAVDSWLTFTVTIYRHLLIICLRRRLLAVTIFLTLLLTGLIIVAAGLVPFKLFATDFADSIFIKAELPPGSSLQNTSRAVAQLENRIASSLPADDVASLITRIGARLDATSQFLEYGSNLALITVDIDEENPACRRPSEIAASLRQLIPEFPQFSKITVEIKQGGPPVGRAVNIELTSNSLPELLASAANFEQRLRQLPGVFNVGNDFAPGKSECHIQPIQALAQQANLDTTWIAREIQGALYGIEAARLRWKNEEVILRVKLDEQFSKNPAFFDSLTILNPQGIPIHPSAFARISQTTGTARIKRLNQLRLITVFADVDSQVTTPSAVNSAIARWIPEIQTLFPTLNVSLAGENEDTERSLESMKFAATIAFLLIYTLLAIITNSFFQPLVIMSVIPFGIIGVILGLLILNQPIGLMSLMGTVALAGIVVNNSLVFVDFINQHRLNALSKTITLTTPPPHLHPFTRWRSIIQSACIRFRPVFLTTATTVAGLTGLAFTNSGQEQFLAPMAQAIVFGLTFASAITLLLIPCLCAILDDCLSLLSTRSNQN